MKIKQCSNCKKTKKLRKFSKDSRNKDNAQRWCKECFKKQYKKYYEKNKNKRNKYSKKYKKNHKKEIAKYMKKYNKKYHKKNKEKIVKQSKKYRQKHRKEINKKRKIKLKENINFKIAHNLRVRIHKALKNNYKITSSTKSLNCSLNQLKQHLEKQFNPIMSWSNYGSYWEIDHIKPCASFDLSKEKEQRRCFHYSNLQPLTIYKNRSKGGKWEKIY